jgi:UDP-glucose 4-epimerase
MKLLVTGGAGFIGSALVDRLVAEGHDVEALDDLSTGSLANLADARAERSRRFAFHQVDVRDPHVIDLMVRRAPEVVLHLAGQPHVPAAVAGPAADADVTVRGTVNVLEGARRAGARKVVVASSASLYGEVPARQLPAKESQPLAPCSPAGASARAVLEYLRVYRHLHGLEHTALALANVYGPRQRPDGEAAVVAAFSSRLLAGEACTVHGDGEQNRDFVFVDDCVDALVRAVGRGDGLLVNVGTGVQTTINDLYAAVAATIGADRPARTAAARPGDVGRSALDPGRAAIQLGWSPWTPLAEGIARVVEWLEDQRL